MSMLFQMLLGQARPIAALELHGLTQPHWGIAVHFHPRNGLCSAAVHMFFSVS
ncbi:MAG: hypothetical protein KatS3mg077_3367 [Candidatus Binatia bacterium]|nr:MAG: hypothetical protein KatS3mg077_3367 [Candidatus Binatia bacterium]